MVLPIGYREAVQRVEASTTLAAPADEIFGLLSDLANLPTWMSGVRSVRQDSPGPMRLGTTARLSRVLMGQHIDAPLTVTAWEPPRLVTLSSTVSGVVVDATVTVAEEGADASRLTLVMTINAGGLGAFMEPMIARAAQADLEASLDRLRAHFAGA